jgi:hypothetical protein
MIISFWILIFVGFRIEGKENFTCCWVHVPFFENSAKKNGTYLSQRRRAPTWVEALVLARTDKMLVHPGRRWKEVHSLYMPHMQEGHTHLEEG